MPPINAIESATLPPPTALAEQGKLHALKGEHALALVYYRVAMQQTSGNDTSHRILSRYFAECALESFEKMGDFESVLAYCQQALEHYVNNPPAGIIAWKDQASIYQRKCVVFLKSGDQAAAESALLEAQSIARTHNLKLPLMDSIGNWFRTRLTISPQRLEELLNQKQYYAITRRSVNPSIAAPIPPHLLKNFQPGAHI